MARIMSLVMLIFMIVPILAPSFGQGVLAISSWRHIFIGLAVYGLVLALWAGIRLPETLAPEARRPLSAAHIGQAAMETLRNRTSIGNTIAVTLAVSALFSFITSVQQIVFDVFHRPELIGVLFACIAGPMGLSSYANSRLVHRFGSRRLLLGALAAFTTAAIVHLVIAEAIGETIWSFALMQAITMSCFGLIGSNAGALAMEPLGHIAGTASSLQGVITTVGGALVGFIIGQNFNGTTTPFLIGFSICGALGLAAAYWANPKSADRHGGPTEEDEAILVPPASA
jgi:DHA1 family bicyclomycin/chloramphenicol resistance-like MFS transporter